MKTENSWWKLSAFYFLLNSIVQYSFSANVSNQDGKTLRANAVVILLLSNLKNASY